MKAINISLRVGAESVSCGRRRAQRSSAAFKKIARKRLRAAEREFFQRELFELHITALAEQKYRARIASRLLERLHDGASTAVRTLLDQAHAAAEGQLGTVSGRTPFYVRRLQVTGEHQTMLLTVASCAEAS